MNSSEKISLPATEAEIAALRSEANTLYRAARAREGAPFEMLDRLAAACRSEQGTRVQAGDLTGVREVLQAAVEAFRPWAHMSDPELPGAVFELQSAPTSPAPEAIDVQAKNLVAALRGAGIGVRLTDDGKAARIDGADRLTAHQRDRLETLARPVLAHLLSLGETLVVRVKA